MPLQRCLQVAFRVDQEVGRNDHRRALGDAVADLAGEASWPIAAAIFMLMHKEPADKAASAASLKFFKWAFAKGEKMAEERDYIPIACGQTNRENLVG